MILGLIGLCIQSMVASLLAIILIHIITGWVAPPLGFFYLTVAYMCRFSMMNSRRAKENNNEDDQEEE